MNRTHAIVIITAFAVTLTAGFGIFSTPYDHNTDGRIDLKDSILLLQQHALQNNDVTTDAGGGTRLAMGVLAHIAGMTPLAPQIYGTDFSPPNLQPFFAVFENIHAITLTYLGFVTVITLLFQTLMTSPPSRPPNRLLVSNT